MTKSGILKYNTALLLLCVAMTAIGLFNDYISMAFSAVLCVWLMVVAIQNKGLRLRLNFVSVFVAVTVLLYLLSALWAVDSGVAVFGFFKFLPLLLYLLLCYNTGIDTDDLLGKLPYFVGGVTIITAILARFEPLQRYFTVAGRLSGTFQYSNTYAILCLVCIIFLLTGSTVRLPQLLTSLVLLFGILYSGSRTVLLLTGVTVIILFFRIKGVRLKLCLAAAAVAAAGLFFGYSLLRGDTDILQRLMHISVYESSFAGRLLYWVDALPTVVTHPFGLGYMGYYFAQGGFKTGLYAVMFAHNDFLQLLLDVGWAPFILLVVAVVQTLRSKNVSFTRKLALLIFSAHVVFDFDWQFVSMFLLYLLLLDWDSGKEVTLSAVGGCAACVVAALLSLYFGTVTFLQYLGKNEAALALYPYNTFSQIETLSTGEDWEQLNRTAEDILARNKTVSLAYNVRARYSYQKGDFAEVIKQKKLAIQYNYYDGTEYEDMCRMLIVGINLYNQAGDRNSADYCARELLRVPRYITDAKNRQSGLGKIINDQPELTLSAEVEQYIQSVRAENS